MIDRGELDRLLEALNVSGYVIDVPRHGQTPARGRILSRAYIAEQIKALDRVHDASAGWTPATPAHADTMIGDDLVD